MKRKELVENIRRKGSFLCVGLDTDIKKIPEHLLREENPIFAFNKAIIDATAPYCVAYKPNLAFYESLGVEGWLAFEETVKYIKANYPDQFIIADAKRGDIGNTSKMYARSFFEHLDIDAVTVAPYMGEDSVTPFLGYEGKWVILLALTSNKGSHDFQFMKEADGKRLFENVITKSQGWAGPEEMMYVVGATQGEMFKDIRGSRRRRTGRQSGRGGKVRHDRRLRTACELFARHHLCFFRRGFRRSSRTRSRKTARPNGRIA